jgi:electron transfer flavoprotein beta subunit
MRIVVCVKEVLDPDAVGAYAIAGGLVIGDDGRSLTQSTIPRLMNAYDEQAIEAALRLRDAGVDCTVEVVSVGSDLTSMLRHASALGADEVVAVDAGTEELDGHAVAQLLAARIAESGGADLVLCGRQASDDDQGAVSAMIAERLGAPLVSVARSVEVRQGDGAPVVRVVRVTPEGDEVVEVDCPAVVTISSELGEPRYPTMPMKMAARKVTPEVVTPGDLSLDSSAIAPRVRLVRQYVPVVQGDCELIGGEGPAEWADRLVQRLVEEKVLKGGVRS